jgi:hypothetical protein
MPLKKDIIRSHLAYITRKRIIKGRMIIRKENIIFPRHIIITK